MWISIRWKHSATKSQKKKSRRSLLFLKSHFRICAISIVHTKTIRKIFTFCHRVKRYSRHHCTALLAAAFTPKYHFLHVMFPKWEISTGRKWRKVQQDIQNLMMVLLVCWKVITFCIAAKGFLFFLPFLSFCISIVWGEYL